jgi:superfamily II DNA or RNA helicase
MRSYLDNSSEDFKNITESCSLLIIDEAHMSLAPTYEYLIKKVVSNGCLLMGLTATPGRNLDDDIDNQRLAELYFQTPVRLECPDGGNVFSYLRNIGVMANTSMNIIEGSNTELTNNEIESFQRKMAIPASVLKRLAAEEQRNLVIIYKILKLIELNANTKILLFACSVKHSKFLTSVLKYKGIKAAHVDGTTQNLARKGILADFKTGTTNVLLNYSVLATGFDAPKTDVVFVARPTGSIVLYSQIIGRGLRGPAIGGTEKCMIINVKDNIEGLPDYNEIYDYFDDYYVE